MGSSDIARNLRRLRLAGGFSQVELASRAGLSVAGYRKIEQGSSAPRYDTLEALSGALGVPLRTLMAPVRQLARARFRSSKKLRLREQILCEVADRLAAYRELEEITGVPPPSFFGESFLAAGVGRPTKEAAAAARGFFGLDEEEPVRDICGLLESRAVRVLAVSRASEGFFGLSAWDDGLPAIIVNTWERISVERWIFTAAHELGHLLLHGRAYDASQAAEERQEEEEANEFASHFLMPAAIFEREWRQARGLPLVSRVLKVKRMFRVSYRSVLYRAHELSPAAGLWARFHTAYRRQCGKSLLREDEPERLRWSDFRGGDPEAARSREPEGMAAPDFLQDGLWNLVRSGVESGRVSLGRGGEVLGLSLVEMRSVASSWAA